MSDLRLYYAPDNASLCVRLALEAVGIAYDTTLVDRRARGHKSPDYLALNPNGLIPVLETPDGAVFETGAILLWLSEAHDHALMPPPGAPERAAAIQWMMWLANTLHPALRMVFYPDQYIDRDARALRSKTKDRIFGMLDMLQDARGAGWLDRSDITLQGCYLAPILRWLQIYAGRPGWLALDRWPRLITFAQAADAWPATQVAAQAEGLGLTPFSQPALPHPPEGTAI